MTTTPAVSVVISVYNSEQYLRACAEGLRSQTYKEFEAILVDPGSHDRSAEICSQLAKEDSRFRYLKVDGSTLVSHCRAKAVEAARAPLVAILDSDDVAFPKRLEMQLQWMSYYPHVVVLGTYYRVISETGWILRLAPIQIQNDIEMRWRLLFGNCLTHSTVMFRKEAALAAGNYDAKVRAGEDFEFYTRMLGQGQFFVVPKVLGAWRVHKRSLSRTEAPDFKSDFVTTVQNSIRIHMGENIPRPVAAALYSQSGMAAENAETFRQALAVIERAEATLRSRLPDDPLQHRLLTRSVFLKMLQMMTHNSRQTWWAAEEPTWGRTTRVLTIGKNHYRWYLDKGLIRFFKAFLTSDARFLIQRTLY